MAKALEVKETESAPIIQPDDSIAVVVDGKTREFFMSFNMLNQLSKLAPQLEDIPMISLSPELREEVLRITLLERKENGKRISLDVPQLEDYDINETSALALLDWVASHLYFFTFKALTKVKEQQDRSKGQSQLLEATLAGIPVKIS